MLSLVSIKIANLPWIKAKVLKPRSTTMNIGTASNIKRIALEDVSIAIELKTMPGPDFSYNQGASSIRTGINREMIINIRLAKPIGILNER